MRISQESLASWATIVGTVVSVLALIQSRSWLVLTSLFFVAVSITTGVYARREHKTIDAASVEIEGHSIDSLNVANLRRRVNQSLVIQEAHHLAEIEGEDLKISWRYTGYCRTGRESAMEFSIDSDASTPFDRLDCFAYDLSHDPDMSHKIRPFLVGPEGASKKISVPFLEPLAAEQSFGVLLKCVLPGCIKPGFGYYASTLSFNQGLVRKSVVHLTFVGPRPDWLRVYECSGSGQTKLLKTLVPLRQDREQVEYEDVTENLPGQSVKIYAFWRSSQAANSSPSKWGRETRQASCPGRGTS